MTLRRAAFVAALAAIAYALFVWRPTVDDRPASLLETSPPPAAEKAPSATPTAPRLPQTRRLYPRPVVVDPPSDPNAAARFSGRVVDRTTNRGIPGAELTFAQGDETQSVVTAAEGRFTYSPPGTGTYRVAAVTAEGFMPFAPAWGRSPLALTARPGRRVSNVFIALDPMKTVSIQVVDDSGAPIPEAAVRLLMSADQQSALIPLPKNHRTDQAGTMPDCDAARRVDRGKPFGVPPDRRSLDVRRLGDRTIPVANGRAGGLDALGSDSRCGCR